MTAKKVLQQWVHEHRELKTAAEKQVFYQKVKETLDAQTSENHVAGLLALKDAVNKKRVGLEQNLSSKSTAQGFRVFPSREEDHAFLQDLFYRMNIPYELTT